MRWREDKSKCEPKSSIFLLSPPPPHSLEKVCAVDDVDSSFRIELEEDGADREGEEPVK